MRQTLEELKIFRDDQARLLSQRPAVGNTFRMGQQKPATPSEACVR